MAGRPLLPRGRLVGLAALAAGAAAGAALEDVAFRRWMRRDSGPSERIGSVEGESSWVRSFDGTNLYTRTYGPRASSGTIVFAHGFVESHLLWHYQLRDLSADGAFRLVAYDSRGHGHSGAACGPDRTTKLDGASVARDLAAVIDQATEGPVVCVGHSMGGMATLELLARPALAPLRERVAGAIVVCSTFTGRLSGWREGGPRWQRTAERTGDIVRRLAGGDARRIGIFRPRPSDLAMVGTRLFYGSSASKLHMATSLRMFDRTPAQTLAAGVDLNAFDVYADLPNIDVPVVVVGGSRDLVTPVWLSEETARRIPGAELVVFDGCGHVAPYERREELTARIRKLGEELFNP